MIVYVERKVIEDPAIANEGFVSVKKNFCTFREGEILSKSIQLLFVCVLQCAWRCTDEYIIEYYLICICTVVWIRTVEYFPLLLHNYIMCYFETVSYFKQLIVKCEICKIDVTCWHVFHRLWWYFQLCRLHHLLGRRWDFAVCFLSLPGLTVFCKLI